MMELKKVFRKYDKIVEKKMRWLLVQKLQHPNNRYFRRKKNEWQKKEKINANNINK